MKQKGFTLIELLVVIAILGVIAAVVALNVGGFFGQASKDAVGNRTVFEELSTKPIASLNLTELNFLVDYCKASAIRTFDEYWGILATVYQNQIIIIELTGGNHS